jgi:Tfp pilus assembly protein PilN
MINLLPPHQKEQLLYSKKNSKSIRWLVASAIVLVGVIVVLIGGYIYLSNIANSYSSQIETTEQQLQAQSIEETQKEIAELSNRLDLTVKVLSQQILFSELLKQIGSVMPRGTVLTSLSINELEGGIDLSAAAINYPTATQVQINLEDPANKIFDKADIVNINFVEREETEYNYNVVLRALFAESNDFTFKFEETEDE